MMASVGHKFRYELWNGKKVVGFYDTLLPLVGLLVTIPTISTLKQPYSSKVKEIQLPIITRLISDNGVDVTIRRCLDVRRKSNKQIKTLKELK